MIQDESGHSKGIAFVEFEDEVRISCRDASKFLIFSSRPPHRDLSKQITTISKIVALPSHYPTRESEPNTGMNRVQMDLAEKMI